MDIDSQLAAATADLRLAHPSTVWVAAHRSIVGEVRYGNPTNALEWIATADREGAQQFDTRTGGLKRADAATQQAYAKYLGIAARLLFANGARMGDLSARDRRTIRRVVAYNPIAG